MKFLPSNKKIKNFTLKLEMLLKISTPKVAFCVKSNLTRAKIPVRLCRLKTTVSKRQKFPKVKIQPNSVKLGHNGRFDVVFSRPFWLARNANFNSGPWRRWQNDFIIQTSGKSRKGAWKIQDILLIHAVLFRSVKLWRQFPLLVLM